MRTGVPGRLGRHQPKRSEKPTLAAPPRPTARRAPFTPSSPSTRPHERVDPDRRGIFDPHALGRRALAAGDRPLHLAQLEVFQKRVRRRERREREPGRAVEESKAQERPVEELPQDAPGQQAAVSLPGGPLRFGGERRVAVELLEVMREVAIRAVEDRLFEGFDRARGENPLVDGIVRKPRARLVVQAGGPHDGVAPEVELAPKEFEADRDAEGRGRRGFRRSHGEADADLEGELPRDDFVGVDRQDPAVGRERRRGVLLAAEAVEGSREDIGSRLPRDLLGTVGRRGVHDDDALVREGHGSECVRQAVLFVAGDESDAEAGLFRGRHRAWKYEPETLGTTPPYTPRPWSPDALPTILKRPGAFSSRPRWRSAPC